MARTASLENKVFASAGIKVNPDNDTSAGADLLTIDGGHIDAQGPYSSHVNFIENRQDALLNLIEKHGILPWSPLTSYENGALCKVDRTFYQLVEGGDGTQDPSTDDGSNWEEFTSGGGGSSFVDVQTEEITLALDQTEVTLSNASTSNMELYIEGAREFDFTVTGQKTFDLPELFPAGTRIWAVSAESHLASSIGSDIIPSVDGGFNIGSPPYRWGAVYAETGTINTSDEREKTPLEYLSDAELRVASKVKALIRKYKWLQSVGEKGEKARWHFGVGAQSVKEAFEAEGLDGFEYGCLCYDEWGEGEEDGVDAGSRYGVRPDELLFFMIAAL